MYCIILCGGSGTRLWPLSRKNYPKQFLNLYGDKSLLQNTFLRMKKIVAKDRIFLVTNRENYFNTLNQIKEVNSSFTERQIITEPAGKNTAPAITLGVRYLVEVIGARPDDPIIEVHSDHYIKDEKEFTRVAKLALTETGDKLGAIGITPRRPETGFGYIKKGKKIKGHFEGLEFVEKPDAKTAAKYISSGKYLWNAGMYIFTPRTLERELKTYAPKIHSAFIGGYEKMLKNFNRLAPISFDNAVSEKSADIITFEGNFGWYDIGSFDLLLEMGLLGRDARQVNVDAKNISVHSPAGRLVAAVGVNDLIVIDSADSILVQKKGQSQDVKKVVERLKEKKMKELEDNLTVYRPWGKYEVLVEDHGHKVKRLTVYPGARLSLQSHERRAEHWVVIEGEAEITNGERQIILKKNESTFIPVKTRHRLGNPGKKDLEIIEVQSGDYLEEDDIKRYDDVYNRK